MKINNIILLVFAAVFLAGIIILMNSLNYGQNEMSGIMSTHGGGMDTNQYLIFLEQSINKYRSIGSILSILGGLGFIKVLKY